MNDVVAWLTDGSHWTGSEGVWLRLTEHLIYSGLALVVAAIIAVPAGLYVGHTGRGRFLAVNLAGGLRAVPSLGLLFLTLMLLGPRLSGEAGVTVPVQLVLVVLAIPPILAGAYAGVEQVEADVRDAARGMGMRGREVLLGVEVPCALPLIVSGLRSAALQVVATATLAATVGLGGLGRFLIDGLAVRDYPQMAAGALLVAALALLVDLVGAAVHGVVVSPGLTRKTGRRTHRGPTPAATAAPTREGTA